MPWSDLADGERVYYFALFCDDTAVESILSSKVFVLYLELKGYSNKHYLVFMTQPGIYFIFCSAFSGSDRFCNVLEMVVSYDGLR